jgi:hypothetical protein
VELAATPRNCPGLPHWGVRIDRRLTLRRWLAPAGSGPGGRREALEGDLDAP